jgi:hypothetical protein
MQAEQVTGNCTYSEVHRYRLRDSQILNLSFHRSQSLLVFFQDKMLRFDLKTECVVERMPLRSACVCTAHCDLAFVGTRTGSIDTFVAERSLKLTSHPMPFQDDYVACMSFAKDYFLLQGPLFKVLELSFNLQNLVSFPASQLRHLERQA